MLSKTQSTNKAIVGRQRYAKNKDNAISGHTDLRLARITSKTLYIAIRAQRVAKLCDHRAVPEVLAKEVPNQNRAAIPRECIFGRKIEAVLFKKYKQNTAVKEAIIICRAKSFPSTLSPHEFANATNGRASKGVPIGK